MRIVSDKRNGKPRGYAFIEFEHKRDMNVAYKEADNMKVDGRRISVDYERGRVQKDWLPRRYLNLPRFGGGKGKSRQNKEIDPILEEELKKIRPILKSRSRSHDKKDKEKTEKERD